MYEFITAGFLSVGADGLRIMDNKQVWISLQQCFQMDVNFSLGLDENHSQTREGKESTQNCNTI